MIDVIKKDKRPEGVAQFQYFPLGENTSVPPSMLDPRELAECIDFKFNPGGQLETRPPVIKYTDTVIGSIVDIKGVTIDGDQYELCTDANDKVYYLDGATPTEIGTAAGTPYIESYNNAACITDGSFLKFCDSISAVKIAYDAGDDGTQYDNYAGTWETETTLSAARVAVKFTSATWDAGYTIPVTKIEAKVQESGGTASITAKLRKVSDDSVLASKLYTGEVPSAAADYISISFTSTDVTTEMSPTTAYYASLEGSNFNVQCSPCASGGVAYTYAPSVWTADTTKNPMMKVYPGVPPKASFLRVCGNKPWVKDPDDPGLAKFGNNTYLDWSSDNGGGSIGVIDDDKDSFEIGAFESFYGVLYVYGTQETPYLCQLQGTTPDDYSLPLMFQRAWSTPRTLVNANSDLWSGSKDGVDTLAGVEAYGDLRTFSASDPIKNQLSNWNSSTAFGGYNARDGQYWLYMPGYAYVLIAHVKQGVTMDNGQIRYPWTRYTLPITPTCFRQVGDNFLIGATDGYIYKLDSSEYKDLATTQIYPSCKIAYTPLPFKRIDLVQFQLIASSTNGSNMDIDFFVDGNLTTAIATYELSLPMSDAVTIADIADIELSDLLDVALTPDGSPLFFDLNINCYSFQVQLRNIHSAGTPVFINGLIIRYESVEG